MLLLRRYEPILAFTRGERFFTVDVDDYLGCCSLWRGEERLVPAGEPSRDDPDANLSLLLVQRPFDRRKVRRHRGHVRPSSGRLAAVGLVGRVFDVLLRGSVPGGVAVAAAIGLAAVYGGRYVLLVPMVLVAGVLLVVNLRELLHR